jgi:uracil-DNA glycosylase family 4
MKSISNEQETQCNVCPLAQLRRRKHELQGSQTARFLVVTDTPSMQDYTHGRIMSSDVSAVFARAMQKEGFAREDFAFVPHVLCSYEPDKFSPKERREIQNCCRPALQTIIKQIKPEVILPLGVDATKQVLGRAVKITKVRGVPEYSKEHKALVLPMLNPLQVVLYPQHASSFAADCATLGRLVDHNYDIVAASDAAMGQYQFIDDLQFLIDEEPGLIAFDTETTSLRWYAPEAKILTMQFSTQEGTGYLLPWDHPDAPRTNRQKARLKRQLIDLLCHPDVTVVGQQLKYDALMLWAQTDIRIRIGGDTLMLATLIDENALTKGLDELVKRYASAMSGYSTPFDSSVDKTKMIEQPLDNKFLNYAAGDADATLRVYNVLMQMVEKDTQLLACYNQVTLPALNTFGSIETRGMYIDEAEVEVFEAFMQQKVNEAYTSLLQQVPRSIKRKHVEKGLKFSRPDFTRDILFNHPDGLRLTPKAWTKTTAKLDPERRIPSISSKDHLPFFYEEYPFTLELSQYVKDARMLGTSVIGFKNKYIHDGMVRPTYGLHTAVTGRVSAVDPNSMNYPKRGTAATAYRKLFPAPEGCYIIEADYSQIELRIAAEMANEQTMLRIYREGGDIHIHTAITTMGITREQFDQLSEEEQYLARFKAKAVGFGYVFGMWWKKFRVYAKTQYGIDLTEREAQRSREQFFELYPGLVEWHRNVREMVREFGFIRSYSGRIRHLPTINSSEEWIQQEAERQGINFGVQNFATDIALIAMSRLEQDIDPECMATVSFVHDAIYTYVPCQFLEWGAKTLKHYMESVPIYECFGRHLKVPIIADVSFGLNLGDTHALKGLKTDGVPSGVLGRARQYAENAPYDFSKFWNEDKQEGIIVPRQYIPENGGRRIEPMYTPWRKAA